MSAIGLNGDTSYKIKSGAYSITVDLGLNTIYAVRLGDNVNDAAVEAAKVVAGIGEIESSVKLTLFLSSTLPDRLLL